MPLALVCLMTAFGACGAEGNDDERIDPQEISASDVPADAPTFDAFPAVPYTGANAPLQFGNDREARLYRTRLREWSTHKVNFAGHYILADWGCGSGCLQTMLIDAQNGHVFHPEELSAISWYDVDPILMEDSPGQTWTNEGPLKFTSTSKLLIALGAPSEDSGRRGISYYVWDHERLKLVRRVAKPFAVK